MHQFPSSVPVSSTGTHRFHSFWFYRRNSSPRDISTLSREGDIDQFVQLSAQYRQQFRRFPVWSARCSSIFRLSSSSTHAENICPGSRRRRISALPVRSARSAVSFSAHLVQRMQKTFKFVQHIPFSMQKGFFDIQFNAQYAEGNFIFLIHPIHRAQGNSACQSIYFSARQ